MSFAKSDWWNLWRRVQNFPGGKDLFKKNRISGKHRGEGVQVKCNDDWRRELWIKTL